VGLLAAAVEPELDEASVVFTQNTKLKFVE
jgi:hypothetical protein